MHNIFINQSFYPKLYDHIINILHTKDSMAKILLVTDAWEPQVNGVVTTLTNITKQAKIFGDEITVFHPQLLKFNFPYPQYPKPSWNFLLPNQCMKIIQKGFDFIHIATPEAYIGHMFVRACVNNNIVFSTGCHTKFAEYLHARYHIPIHIGWKWMLYANKHSRCIITPTPSMKQELINRQFTQKIEIGARGIDREIFYPGYTTEVNVGRPVLINVGRVSEEKGLDDFCQISYGPRATKVIIGDGPYRQALQSRYPNVLFTGMLQGKELADWYRLADCFVFPSVNDTFGVVMLEAIACGTPIAAYPVTGPIDIIHDGITGACDWKLENAIKKCLDIDRKVVYSNSMHYSWEESYKIFRKTLV